MNVGWLMDLKEKIKTQVFERMENSTAVGFYKARSNGRSL